MAKQILDGFEKAFEAAVYGALGLIGANGVDKLKSALSNTDGVISGRLGNSLSFSTTLIPPRGSTDNPEDLVPQPDTPMTLLIGTRCYYSRYYEFGVGPPVNGGGGFREKILAWAKAKGFDERTAYAIVRSIALKGTFDHPFFYPSVPVITAGARMIMALEMKKFFGKYKSPPVTVELNIKA